MRILIFVLLLLGTSIHAQNVLTCYDYHDFSGTDCVGCGLKDSTFSGILLVKNGTIYQPLVKPLKIKTRPNILDMEDGFATRVSIYIDQITTYNTEASVLAFLRACACGVTIDSTMITEGWGINVTEPTANNYVIEADSSQVATTYDLTLKQDLLNGVAPRIPYFTSATTLGTTPNLLWDDTNNELEIKAIPIGSNATGQAYFGLSAAFNATGAIYSNLFGQNAGYGATSASYSNFFGFGAGQAATGAYYSNFFGRSAGYNATSARQSNFFGYNAGNSASSANNSNFFGVEAGSAATSAYNSNFFGSFSGYQASSANSSNFFGSSAGYLATAASFSNFYGTSAGREATNALHSNFFGNLAGYQATNASFSNFFGNYAGIGATGATFSNFYGQNAGYYATGAAYSNFFGDQAGSSAHSASYSNFFGYQAGKDAYFARYSNLFGYKVGISFAGNTIRENNIIIGKNISLPDSSINKMNIGGVLFGTGFQSDDTGNPKIVPTVGGKIGVLTSSPTQQLHVDGNIRVEDAYYDSNNEPGISGQILSTTVTGTDWVDMAGGDTTQYLNPYIMGPDTVGFYLTIAQDTVLFVATADTTAGTVDIVTGTSPIIITGDATHTPNVTIQNATTSQSGALTSTDWNTFNGKVGGSGTATRVAFWSGTSTLSSNANLYWDNTNSRLGIGTVSPSRQLTTTQDISANGNDIGLGGGNQPNNARFGNAALNNNTTGVGNLAIGAYALLNNTTGYYNIALGNQAMFYNVSGHTNTAIGQNTLLYNIGSKNTGIGTEALYSLTSGVENTAISALALRSNVTGNSNIAIGFGAGYYETGSNKLYIEPTTSSTPLIGGDFVTDRVGINTPIGSIARTLHVTGEVRITDLTTDTPTKLVGADGDGDFGEVALSGLSMVSGTLTNSFNGDITAVTVTAPLTGGGTSGSISVGLDTTSATGVATKYDLTQISGGSSKVIDILGSDYTTSATSLQSTALAYTFPSTGTYEIKVYGSYTCSNTANGINVGFIDSGGLVASYITGKHMAFTNNTSSSSTETRKPISAIGTTLSTASVGASSTKYTVMSEALITVSTAGTITLGFASGSGSYSATLQAGSSLLIEKLN